ncbi:MAG TPA: uroporphyrinogen-III C-methyltransferase [Gammaproteobacteria bacterium]|nr:uroporphyrinogen-III C-methyltransferase [Gammaproteobacteria bacterium]HQZ87346.1 uroporphyrinogen-III C-methyltransferase [Gammaproteobacteria bacterium]HRA43009.1 uroporphyrinogen-III C-methyltransferase [Gammaproteobacteria bacterium]
MKTAIFSLIIAISVGILSAFQFERYQTLSSSTHASLAALENKMNLSLASLRDELTKLKTSEEAILTQAQNPTFKTAELEYLIRLASARLQTTRDLKAAIELLTLAQTKIQTLNDLHLSPLSEAIEKDILTLQQASTLNVEDLWLKVSDIIDQTASISSQTLTANAQQTEATAQPQPQEKQENTSRLSILKQGFFESLESIKDFIKIRHSTQRIEPLLSETQKNLIQENLRSLLEQIRLAILTTEDKIFQKALKDTQQWLSRYYDETDPVVQKMQNTITELLAIQLRPTLPLITAVEFFNTLNNR